MASYTYDKNRDYQAEIDRYVSEGNYAQAAIAEQQRNAKIRGEGITDYAETNNYSQYLKDAQPVNGYTYDNNTDYQQLINDAVARGDYYAAAIAEQQRNAKIYGEGIGDYTQTQNYASYLPGGANYAQGQMHGVDTSNPQAMFEAYMNIAMGGTPGATDHSDMINEMYAAAQEAQQAQLEADYAEQLAGLDREQEQNRLQYEANLNQTEADAARSQRSFAEQANAYGLGSGTRAQIALSQNNQRSQNINNLRVAQQTAEAEIARQREQARTNYEAAIRQAAAENNYALMQALYEEAQRIDASLQQQGATTSQYVMSAIEMMMQQQMQQEQTDYNRELEAAQYAAAMGNYSLLGALYGWSDSMVQQLNNTWAQQNNPYKGSSGGGGGYYTATDSGSRIITDASQLSEAAMNIANSISRSYGTVQQRADIIMNALASGRIGKPEAEFLMASIGWNGGEA